MDSFLAKPYRTGQVANFLIIIFNFLLRTAPLNRMIQTRMNNEKAFDPNGVGVKNGAFFSLNHPLDSSEILIQSIAWDVTTSYRPGTRNGPEFILDCSSQVDYYAHDIEKPWEMKLGTLPLNKTFLEKSILLREKTEKLIEFLEEGHQLEDSSEMMNISIEVNKENENLHQHYYLETKKALNEGKKVITVGGDHSVSEGPIRAYAEKYQNLSILHFDAHADLRVAYEGFTHSHASIMNRVLETTSVSKLVQLGIRDVSQGEILKIKSDSRIKTYFDVDMKQRLYNGESYKSFCEEVVSHLSENVYISFDIDGLDPKLCPNTGTPVPGGLEAEQVQFLLEMITKKGKKIVGADLVEVAPDESGQSDWDGNVGARMLWQLCLGVYRTLLINPLGNAL